MVRLPLIPDAEEQRRLSRDLKVFSASPRLSGENFAVDLLRIINET